MDQGEGIEEHSEFEGDLQGGEKSVLQRIVRRVIKTGKAAGQQAGDRIRSFRNGAHDEDLDAPHSEMTDPGSTASEAMASGTTSSSSTPPPPLRRVSQSGGNGKGVGKRGTASGDDSPRTRSTLDIALQPLQVFASSVQKQAEVLEGKVGQRISDMEASFKGERAAMGRKLEDQRLASRERLREAETQLQRLQILASEKEKVDETVRRVTEEKEAAAAKFEASTNRLRGEVDLVRDRLDKERRSLSVAKSETLAQRAAQEKERAVAQQRLKELLGELERERQRSKRKQDQLTSEASTNAAQQAQAIKVATDAAAKADADRQRADAARVEAEARVSAAEAAVAAVNADMAAAKSRSESGLSAARVRAELAEAEAVAARSASGMDALQNELARTVSELKEQTRRAESGESARNRIETEATTRSRSLQELMEKNRARYERTTSALQVEIKELSLLKTVAAGFEDMRSKLGIAQSREAELLRQIEESAKTIETLDGKVAEQEDKAEAGAQVLEDKQRALRDAEAQLQAANNRADGLAEDARRLPEMESLVVAASTEAEKERGRADGLQARVDEATAKSELVKDRLFDLERSVEMSEWSERKLAKENEGLQSLIERNRSRYDREVASLKAASSDLAQKTEALKALEAAMKEQVEAAEGLEKQMSELREKSASMASELSRARDMLAEETTKRMQAESALRAASESGYKDRRQVDDELAELARLRVAVGDLESTREEEVLAWEKERSSLTSRLNEALRSSEGLTARVAELEGVVEDLRQASRTSQDEADGERKRLERELEGARASADRVQEERNNLQSRVADLMAALQKATESVSAGMGKGPSPSPEPSQTPAKASTQPGGAPVSPSPSLTLERGEDEGMSETPVVPEVGGAIGARKAATAAGSSGEVRPVPARKKKPRRAILRPWQVGGLSTEAQVEKVAEEVRESQATVAAIDDFLERAQSAVGVDPGSSDPADPAAGHADDSDPSGAEWAVPVPPTKPRQQRSWVPWGREGG